LWAQLQDLPRFLYYVMYAAALTGVFIAQGNPNTIPHLTAEKLRVYRFPFPPTEEQRAIVEFLDRETGKIDVLVHFQLDTPKRGQRATSR